jgi:hypothetical protein
LGSVGHAPSSALSVLRWEDGEYLLRRKGAVILRAGKEGE